MTALRSRKTQRLASSPEALPIAKPSAPLPSLRIAITAQSRRVRTPRNERHWCQTESEDNGSGTPRAGERRRAGFGSRAEARYCLVAAALERTTFSCASRLGRDGGGSADCIISTE